MLHMINSSLDMFKMANKTYQPIIVDVNMVDIIHKIKKELKSLINSKQSYVVISLMDKTLTDGENFTVRGENLLLYSMMANLIRNAAEATPKNKAISIALSNKEDLGFITIHNYGRVPENIQDIFFEKYVTADKKGGTGLGTYSAKLIAETLSGSISMVSSETKGTSICIQLPLGKS